MAEIKKPFHEVVAENLIEQLKAGTAPWQRPWAPGEPGGYMPMNPTTGKRYKGINAIQLLAQGRTDARWMTYKQAAAVGAQVRKGEKGTPVQYWKFSEEQNKVDDNGRPVLDAKGNPVKEIVMLERPRVFFATVFNGEQIDGLPQIQRKEQTWDANDRAEKILQASGAVIRHGENNRAFYRPATDSVHLPDKGQFPTADRYYATALHELGHWTGHASRLDRDLSNPFGSEAYAKEELRAEIASMILGDELGIGHDPGQHAAYVGSWIKVLENDPLEIFRASAEAEKIHDYVLAFEQQQAVKQEVSVHSYDPFSDENFATQVGISAAGSNAVTAEAWVLKHIQDGTLNDALAGATLAQVDRIGNVIDGMQPISRDNDFWGRHSIPNEPREIAALNAKINAAMSYVSDERRPDALVSETFMNLKNGKAHSMERARSAFEQASNEAFGFSLPHDWTGEVRLVGVVKQGGSLVEANLDDAELFHLYARKSDVAIGDDPYKFLISTPSLFAAEELSERLQFIDANAETSELDKAAKLANLHEQRLSRNQASSDVIAAAKETRKELEAKAFPQEQERKYINVPFKEKNEAKQLGARWDRQKQSWYVPPGVDAAPFAKWAQGAATAATEGREEARPTQGATQGQKTAQERVYLAVPYGERLAAKAAGAEWDKAAKSWYAGPNADMTRLERWKPENVPGQQGPAMTPKEEFADALRSLGCIVSGDHPIMDGQRHRITVEGDKKGEQAGFYVGHLDGHPAGYIKNNRTGLDMKWKSKGYTLDPEEKAKLQAEAATKLAERAAEQNRLHEATAQRVGRQTENLVPVTQPTPYMQAKAIEAHAGLLTDKDGQKTYIPAFDVDGKQWTMQYIQEDGTKRFAKDSRKDGCFHPVGGMDAVAAAPALVIAEGYATAATLAESLGQAIVAAFDSGNLPAVARALHEKFPDKPVIIAGDDDRHQVITQGTNPGRTKAEEAAKAVGGTAIFPIFAPGENSYPANLPPITPQIYREHERAMHRLEAAQKEPEKVQLTEQEAADLKRALLSPEQLAGLAGMKSHTDFNDLATRSELGREGVVRQAGAAVSQALQAQEQRQEQKQKLEHDHKQEQRPRRAMKV